MIEELGKWMLDISKYIITAYVLVRMFGKEDDSVWTLVSAILLAALLFGMGLYFVKRGKENLKKERKIIMDYGLLGMYIFLALIAVGSFIYVKIEDRKEQKNS